MSILQSLSPFRAKLTTCSSAATGTSKRPPSSTWASAASNATHHITSCAASCPLSKTVRCLSSTSTSSSTSSTTTWQRSAVKVKNIDIYNNQYLEHIRDTHDPSQHIKTLEEELMGTMGQALGKQGAKIVESIKDMQKHLLIYEEAVERYEKHKSQQQEQQQQQDEHVNGSNNNTNTPLHHHPDPDVIQAARAYNEARERALKKRWELLVHRQAAGFTVNNHNHVTKLHPIGPAISVEDDERNNDEHDGNDKQKTKKKTQAFGDQLDWWQRIGRWK